MPNFQAQIVGPTSDHWFVAESYAKTFNPDTVLVSVFAYDAMVQQVEADMKVAWMEVFMPKEFNSMTLLEREAYALKHVRW